MEITTNKQTLEAVLSTSYRAVNHNNLHQALTGMVISAKDGILSVTGSDLEVAVTNKASIEIIDEGEVLVPAKQFYELVKRLPNGPTNIRAEEDKIIVLYGKQNAQIKTLPLEEYPTVPEVIGTTIKVSDISVLLEAAKKVHFACSKDLTRPVLGGVFLKGSPFGAELVASDGYRINRCIIPIGDEVEIIIPQKTIEECIKSLKGNALIVISDNAIKITSENVTIVSRLINGKFVDYKTIKPDIAAEVIVNAEEILGALDRALLFKNKIQLIIEDNCLKINSSDVVGEVNEQLNVDYSGHKLMININGQLLKESLSVCQRPTLCFTHDSKLLMIKEGSYSGIIAALIAQKEVAA